MGTIYYSGDTDITHIVVNAFYSALFGAFTVTADVAITLDPIATKGAILAADTICYGVGFTASFGFAEATNYTVDKLEKLLDNLW